MTQCKHCGIVMRWLSIRTWKNRQYRPFCSAECTRLAAEREVRRNEARRKAQEAAMRFTPESRMRAETRRMWGTSPTVPQPRRTAIRTTSATTDDGFPSYSAPSYSAPEPDAFSGGGGSFSGGGASGSWDSDSSSTSSSDSSSSTSSDSSSSSGSDW